MKILMVGESWRGSLCYSYLRAFKNLDCEIVSFDQVQEYKNLSRLTNNLLMNRLLEIYFSKLMNKKLINLVHDFMPDLCVIAKGQYIFPKTILTIKMETNALLFNINADDPFNKNHGASSKNVRKSLEIYDCYFIWSKSLISKLKNAGVKKVEYLPFGFDPYIHYPISPLHFEQKESGNDVVFVGDWDKEREEWLKELVDFDLGIWGTNYWKTRCRDKNLRKKWRRRAMYSEDMSCVLNSSKISLNILRVQNKGSHNMRTFEVPACQAFALSERSPEAKEFFAEDKEAVYFSNPAELKDKIHYYLSHEQARKQIVQAGYERCIASGYSYLDRAKRILKVYEDIESN